MAGVSRRSPFTLRAAVRRQAVLTWALVSLALIGVVALSGRVPLAGMLTALLLGFLAVTRATRPTEKVGALAVRSRAIDVTVLATLAVGLAVLSMTPNL